MKRIIELALATLLISRVALSQSVLVIDEISPQSLTIITSVTGELSSRFQISGSGFSRNASQVDVVFDYLDPCDGITPVKFVTQPILSNKNMLTLSAPVPTIDVHDVAVHVEVGHRVSNSLSMDIVWPDYVHNVCPEVP